MVLNILLVTKKAKFILPQMSGYIQIMFFMVKNDEVPDKCNEIWDKIKNKLSIKFHSMPVYDEKYIKAKVREIDGMIKTNFLGDEIPRENKHYTCIAYITIDSVMRMEKKNYLQVQLEEKYNEENKDEQIHRS